MGTILSTYDQESLAGDTIQSVVTKLRRDARALKSRALYAKKRQGVKGAIAKQAVKLVGSKQIPAMQSGKSEMSGLGLWNPFSYIADKATELVTGISPEQVAASEKQAAWAAQAIAEREKAGTITTTEANTLRAQTAEAVADSRQAASVVNTLKTTASEAAKTANSALGDPLGALKRYGAYAAVAAGGVAALYVWKKLG